MSILWYSFCKWRKAIEAVQYNEGEIDMKLGNRVLAFTMSILIAVSSMAPAMTLAAEQDTNQGESTVSSTSPAAVLAAQVEISTQDLFRLYPECLWPDLDRDIPERFRMIYGDFVNDYAGDSIGFASYMYALQNGTHMVLQELAAIFGWGQSVQE